MSYDDQSPPPPFFAADCFCATSRLSIYFGYCSIIVNVSLQEWRQTIKKRALYKMLYEYNKRKLPALAQNMNMLEEPLVDPCNTIVIRYNSVWRANQELVEYTMTQHTKSWSKNIQPTNKLEKLVK